ncbi:unnamed protein product [Miscanthus lutarioriparius]|uniref:KIB1-4 beta-propeller domain-containing protein n=1 Tax=Miscanthus lutarioriparius TaxID=422564 RepID=A0A811MN74_9POAL|nr:unnamed protein product [Miscanthus lutarioriparius]
MVIAGAPTPPPPPTRRSFELTTIVSGSRRVGSSNGWLALSVVGSIDETVFVLLNPIAAVEIILPPLIYKHEDESRRDWVSKLVFTPCPAKDNFAAAAICDIDMIAYVTAGAKRWAVMDPVRLTSEVGDQLTDVVYTDKGKVYCLAKCGDEHVLRLPERWQPERRRRKPANADEAGPSEPEFSVLHPPSPSSPPPLSPSPPRPSPPQAAEAEHTIIAHPLSPLRIVALPYEGVPPESQGTHLNTPATIKPLLPLFDPATLPAGGQRRVAENEILVLRYYPRRRRRPCWDAVKDLGGYSLFVGRNNAVSMYAEGVPGLRGNCVYWIGGMVFDLESGRSTPCGVPQPGFLPGGHPYSTICWYSMSDVMSINNSYNTSSTG